MGGASLPSSAASSAACDALPGGSTRSTASDAGSKRKRGAGQRLSDLQRLEIIRRRRESVASSSSSSPSTSSSLVPLRRLAREFGVDEKTIRRVMENADEIERRASSTSIARRAHAFRRPVPKFPELERRLVQWVDAQQRSAACTSSQRIELSPSAVIDQAKRLAQALGIGEDQFKGSWGWYDKFCKRYGLRAVCARNRLPRASSSDVDARPDGRLDASRGYDGLGNAVGSGDASGNGADAASLAARGDTGALHVENKSPTTRTSASDAIRSADDLHAVIAQYDPNWVFTVDETALLYDHLPPLIRSVMNEAVSAQEERDMMRWMDTPLATSMGRAGNNGTLRDRRRRVTLVACCNSTGTLSLPVAMIGMPRWPARDVSFPAPYLQQEHAWMDRVTFARWFDTVFCAFIRPNILPDTSANGEKTKVLLIVDGDRPGYQAGFEQEGIRVVSIPSTRSRSIGLDREGVEHALGPLRRGVLRELKRRYKHLVLRDAVAFHAAPTEVQRVLLAGAASVRKEEVGVHFGRPPTLLDAARNVALAWGQVSDRARRTCFQRANTTPTPRQGGFEEHEDADGVANDMKRLLTAHVNAFHFRRQPVAVDDCRQIRLPIDEVSRQVDEFLRVDNDNSPILQQALQHELLEQLGGGNVQPVSGTAYDTGGSGHEEQVAHLVAQSEPPSASLAASRTALLSTAQLGVYLRSVRLHHNQHITGAERPNASRDISDRELDSELEASIQAADQLRRFLQRLDADPRVNT